MEPRFISETFNHESIDPLLQWLNPPSSWRVDAARSRLLVEPAADTDFWQRTHYGFRADNGHFLHAEAARNGEITTTVLAMPRHQYDQAGLMLRASEDCWLKASVEYEPDGPGQLGAVVTNNGFSDWSLQDFPGAQPYSYALRIRWQGDDCFVEHAPDEAGPWRLMRVARLHRPSGVPLRCGIYACSPKGAGFQVEFASLRVESR
jgi:regulation of enolase protein 1 (concanavalin A-like superfamily)